MIVKPSRLRAINKIRDNGQSVFMLDLSVNDIGNRIISEVDLIMTLSIERIAHCYNQSTHHIVVYLDEHILVINRFCP